MVLLGFLLMLPFGVCVVFGAVYVVRSLWQFNPRFCVVFLCEVLAAIGAALVVFQLCG